MGAFSHFHRGCRFDEPAVRIELDELAAHRASFVLTSIDAQTLRYGCSATGTPELTASVETGNVHSVSISISIGDLLADTGYRLGVQGIGPGGEEGKVAYLDFHTASAQSDLYPWERSRSSIPVPADMTLIPGPSSHRTPLAWDKERWSAFGKVVIKNILKQETMETDTLYWDSVKHEIWTDCYIHMYSPSGSMQGYGMRSDERARNAILLRPFNNEFLIETDSTKVVVDSVNFIGPMLKK